MGRMVYILAIKGALKHVSDCKRVWAITGACVLRTGAARLSILKANGVGGMLTLKMQRVLLNLNALRLVRVPSGLFELAD